MTIRVLSVAALVLITSQCSVRDPSGSYRQLLLVLDGLRPDYVTPEIMPTLVAFGRRGVVFTQHHSVFPTVTRVNAASFSTGAYPEHHGLLGNSVFFPQVSTTKFLDTSDRAQLLAIEAATGGKLLTAPTLGEVLQKAGKQLLVVSAGSTGSAFLNHHKVASDGSGGAIFHYGYVIPETYRQTLLDELGPPPADAASADERNRWAVDAFLQVGRPLLDPAVTVMWLTDPDTTAHEQGLGSPATLDALAKLDVQVNRLLQGLAAARVLDRFDIWITSDHGFSTHTGSASLRPLLDRFKGEPTQPPQILASQGAIYVRDHDAAIINDIVHALQQTPGVGALFTATAAHGSLNGWVAGTLSFDAIHWTHERSADVLFSPDWTEATNSFGIPGIVAAEGVAGHGSSSPFDIHNTLLAGGPDLKRGVVVRAPSGNADFVPTLLFLLGLTPPASVQGRILSEGLVGGPDPITLAIRSEQHEVSSAEGDYALTARFSWVQSNGREYRYLDQTKVRRSAKNAPDP